MKERNAVHLRNCRDTLPVMTRKIHRSADISYSRKYITFNNCSNCFSFVLTYPGTDKELSLLTKVDTKLGNENNSCKTDEQMK